METVRDMVPTVRDTALSSTLTGELVHMQQ